MKTKKVKVNLIQIIGKRWFQTSYGNTYNTVKIYVNNEYVKTLGMEYGYGSFYRQRAEIWLSENGYTTGKKENESFWAYFDRKKITVIDTVHGVKKCELDKENELETLLNELDHYLDNKND